MEKNEKPQQEKEVKKELLEESECDPAYIEALREENEKFRKELEENKQKVEENWNHFLRAKADLANFQRRSEEDISKARNFAIEKFARELLSVIDSLEQG